MNREFLARCYRTTLALLGVVLPFALVYAGPGAALGFVAAGLLGVLNLRLIEECAVQLIRSGGPRKGRVALAAAIKVPVVYGLGFLLLSFKLGSPLLLAAGFSTIFFVIFMKSLGLLYLARTGVRPHAWAAARNPNGSTEEPVSR